MELLTRQLCHYCAVESRGVPIKDWPIIGAEQLADLADYWQYRLLLFSFSLIRTVVTPTTQNDQ